MDVYIITGTTRGLGAALAAGCIRQGAAVIGISRSDDGSLGELAAASSSHAGGNGGSFVFVQTDLQRTELLPQRLEEALGRLPITAATRMTLIHNAGILGPIGPLEQAGEQELSAHLAVNLTAPLVLSSAFIRLTEPYRDSAERAIVSISSGAGRKPYAGWAVYCTAKAGLDMMSRSIAAEQGEKPGAVRCLSIAPGVIDTGMQEQIRAADEEDFPSKSRFVDLKAGGLLQTPEETADRLIRFIRSGDWRQGDVLDLRDIPAED
ncbi:benzil reductase ((S)-benzoin forming) [Paenibacillus sp. UNCCL117]|uniref:SDR family NAD(P)-dependent oxidoreductase n=1 Tax=unclassified Paenibacillus TaxID=185978 RepID=UPI00088380AB|nr:MULTISPECIES: SDR family NAD(P)-dependent oxidoreductase [unclassified Paenibacillus]SDC53967.1 benzil reductase ((S)-benzoin forming) [Paenibacillus sp. cl123]SFW11116.1 benzil reductase ((S)-benzoin forming) [Paenibacillus sp. UNCCL117]